jgi:hypothetical protein
LEAAMAGAELHHLADAASHRVLVALDAALGVVDGTEPVGDPLALLEGRLRGLERILGQGTVGQPVEARRRFGGVATGGRSRLVLGRSRPGWSPDISAAWLFEAGGLKEEHSCAVEPWKDVEPEARAGQTVGRPALWKSHVFPDHLSTARLSTPRDHYPSRRRCRPSK